MTSYSHLNSPCLNLWVANVDSVMKHRKCCCNVWDAPIWRTEQTGMEFCFYLLSCSLCFFHESGNNILCCATLMLKQLYFRSVITLSLALVHSQHLGNCSLISYFVLVGTFLCDILSIRMISDPSDAWVASESNNRWTLFRTAAKNILCFRHCLMLYSLGKDVCFPKQEKHLPENKRDKILSIILPLTKNKNNLSLDVNDFSRAWLIFQVERALCNSKHGSIFRLFFFTHHFKMHRGFFFL